MELSLLSDRQRQADRNNRGSEEVRLVNKETIIPASRALSALGFLKDRFSENYEEILTVL